MLAPLVDKTKLSLLLTTIRKSESVSIGEGQSLMYQDFEVWFKADLFMLGKGLGLGKDYSVTI